MLFIPHFAFCHPLPEMITKEMGKPLSEAIEEVEGTVDKEEFLGLLEKALEPKKHDKCLVTREALGVVAILSPWNFPADEILFLMLPSLGSGNVCIVKPSEVAPECGAIVVNAIASVLPKGVLQLAQGDGAVGSALVAHADINMICMTGSSATGESVSCVYWVVLVGYKIYSKRIDNIYHSMLRLQAKRFYNLLLPT